MESLFKIGFRSFLESSYIDFIEYGNHFIFPDYQFSVQLVPAFVSPELEDRLPRNSGTDFHNPPLSISDLTISDTVLFQTKKIENETKIEEENLLWKTEGNVGSEDKVFLFEDRWWAAREMVQERILARLERFRSVFARKCKVISGRGNPQFGEAIKEFLKKNHTYSSAKCRYRYALEYEGEIVAVATFSEGRPMVRKVSDMLKNVPKEEQPGEEIVIFDSYEWVRYASLPGIRVAGGMGKLLNAFIEERYTRLQPGTPMEIMTYSDTEWSNGDVYTKLGFQYAGERPPVEYHVNKKSYIRYQQRLYEKELAQGASPDDFYTIHNLGSKKFLLQITPEA